ncbi:TonB-dependent receptor [Sphingoaurantiacus capsulatus]|uniref:TonB-dependent receptor n=1 Tax=Sphingoaurantiacus capsulatus TaxID=1771310 RepID=A0ABV7X6Y0_9SPHN
MTDRFRTALRLTAAATVLALAAPSFAQEAAPSDDEEIIVSAQRRNQTGLARAGSVGALGDKRAEDVPFSIKSYNEALILNQQPQTLGQVLENDPGIRTTVGFGIAGELFVIRGFALAGDDVGFGGLYGIAPRQLVAPELLDSVQVLNGASAFLNGAAPGGSGIGGSVNILPKRAGAQPVGRATVGYTADGHVGGSFDLGRRFGDDDRWGFRVNGAARGGDVSIDDEFRSSYVLGGALDYNSGPLRMSLDLAYQRVKVRHMRPKLVLGAAVTAIPEVPDTEVNYGQPWQYTTLRDVFGQARIEYDLADDVMAYAAFGARDGSERGFYQTITLTNLATGAATASGSFIPRTDNNEAATAGLRAKLGSGWMTHEINVGGNANWFVNRNAFEFYAASPTLTNIYAPIDVPRPSTVTFIGGDLNDPFPIGRTRLMSAFLSDTIGLWDDRVLATLGLRHQEIKTIAYSNATGLRTGGYSENAVTPVFGLVVKPSEGVSLYANRIEGLVAGGTAPATGANPSGGAALPVSNAGEVLPPYESTQYELGGKLNLGGVTASLAWFQIDRDLAILELDPDAAGRLRFGPFGTQRNSGLEFSLEAEPVEGLRLIGGASIIDAKLRKTQNGVNQGNDAIGVPEYLINANVEWDLPFAPALTLTGRVVNTGQQAANLTNTLRLPSWTRFDVGARYVLAAGDKPVTLRFNIDNVANKRYWASAFDTFRPDLQQGAPRTFKLSASVDF